MQKQISILFRLSSVSFLKSDDTKLPFSKHLTDGCVLTGQTVHTLMLSQCAQTSDTRKLILWPVHIRQPGWLTWQATSTATRSHIWWRLEQHKIHKTHGKSFFFNLARHKSNMLDPCLKVSWKPNLTQNYAHLDSTVVNCCPWKG